MIKQITDRVRYSERERVCVCVLKSTERERKTSERISDKTGYRC